MKVDVDYENIQEVSTDGRGRVTLGMEYADEDLVVAVCERSQERDE